jgi:Holliday junction resolvase RusA-like endonuclease
MKYTAPEVIGFTVYGAPVPQGSKRIFRGNIVDMAPQRLRSYRQDIHIAAQQAMDGREVFSMPVGVTVTFFIPRPKNHFGTGRNAEKRKASAPLAPAKPPDIDKLGRAVLDGMTGAVFRDDAQVVSLHLMKVWANHSDAATEVSVLPFTP